MNQFTLTSEQQAIYDSVKKFADEKVAPHAIEWDAKHHLPLDVVRETCALGFGGLYIGAENGGSGLSRLDSVLAFEALATGCPALSAFISVHNMMAWIIEKFGDDWQRKTFLPQLLSMEKIGSYCLSEPSSGSDAAALKTTAKKAGDHYILNGTKQFITGGGANDLFLVFAKTDSGISCFIVDATTQGFSFGPQERKMGWHIQPTSQVILENCKVPATNILGGEDSELKNKSFPVAMAGLDGGRINIAACSLGGATSAFEKARIYSGERHAFGKPINSLQSIQFKLADMYTKLEASRLLLYMAAEKLQKGTADATRACSAAKLYTTDVGFEVANEALQIHGGYGYLCEYGIEKIVRDLRVHQILEGTNEIMRVVISRSLLKEQQ